MTPAQAAAAALNVHHGLAGHVSATVFARVSQMDKPVTSNDRVDAALRNPVWLVAAAGLQWGVPGGLGHISPTTGKVTPTERVATHFISVVDALGVVQLGIFCK